MIEIKIREIKYNSDEYRKELELRDAVLRKPLGMNIYNDNLDADKTDFHIGAFINNQLVGVMILAKLNADDLKMRQVAVDEKLRANKIGSEMVHFAEEYSKDQGFKNIVLNARKSALGFYQKLGYEKISAEFLEINIPHYKMCKRVSHFF
ncbi:MAG: GNAT family N-acetyltransferase [Paludibacter sp.]|nr:GNAT family N-acetyltransferase [Paludibacter sp.]